MDMIICLECPDCQKACVVKFCLLTSDHRVVYLAICARCNDHVTVRCYKTVNPIDWLEAATLGLPIVNYKEAA